MYLSYENLWKQLALYGLKKTELMELTGMSSRTLAKLSKNESVTVETLMKICEVLHCRIEDVMTVSETYTPFSLYDAYCHTAAKESDSGHVTLSDVTYLGKEYRIYVTRKTADKYTVIRCADRSVVWEQMPFSAVASGLHHGQTLPVFSERPEIAKNAVTVFVIAGKPGCIKGLDDGIFRSARHPGGEGFLNVMSMTAFKTFVPLG